MQELARFSRFRDGCCYCYRDAADGVAVCMCDLSFCADHIEMHVGKAGCSVAFEMRRRDEETEIWSKVLGSEEIEELQRRMKMRMQGEAEDVVECPHLDECAMDVDVGSVEALRCGRCDVEKRLWICVTCGFVGCGRVQYGVAGNGHAKQHHEESGHGVFVLDSSLGNADCEAFCYLCDSGIRDRDVRRRLRFCGAAESEVQERVERVRKESVPSRYVGIVNAGNTCYISSALQMVGHVVCRENLDLNMHFEICWIENPLDCFFCQIVKVFNKMKECSHRVGIEEIVIGDLAGLIWRDMPMFLKNVQHDAHEFLLFLVEKIQEGEDSYVLPSITSHIGFEVSRRISCSGCEEESVVGEKMAVLCTIIKSGIRSSVAEALKDEEWECKCGGKKRACSFVSKLPEYLIVQVGRYSFSNEAGKIVDKISMESIKLDKHMDRIDVDAGGVERLVEEGHSKEAAAQALQLWQNDEERARTMLLNGCRVDPKYRVVGCISHTGTNIRAGHYTWWIHDDDGCYLVDDRAVLDSSTEVLEDGYIFLFR